MAKSESFLSRFFRFIWRLIIVIQGLFFLLALLLVPAVLWFLLYYAPGQALEDNVALVWAPTGELVEQEERGFSDVLMDTLTTPRAPQTVLRNLIESLERAADDPRITLAFLKTDDLEGAGPAQLADLAAAIRRFRESGKKVIAWSPYFSQAQYYLAAQADEVYLDPMGFVAVQGYGSYGHYLKDALDKLEVEVNVFRVGEYKTAVEPFTRNDMSPESRAAKAVWLGSLWDSYKKGVAQSRDLQPDAVDAYIEQFPQRLVAADGDAAKLAKQAGLVDALLTVEQMRDKIRAVVGEDESHGSFRQINNFQYLRAARAGAGTDLDRSKVGLIVVEGTIVEGESAPGLAGADTIVRLVSSARRDDDMAAVVLRVNSPGGGIYASEAIRREVEQTREIKPVIVSMSNVAASGGYWVSMNATEIWAQNATITGSIGVFGLIPTIQKPLANLGIHTDGIATTSLAGALRIDRPLQPEARIIMQQAVEKAYRDFTGRVAKARGMSAEAVERVAQGRVWSGSDAQKLGLIDKLGGLEQAIEAAAAAAGLGTDDYRLEQVEPPLSFRQWLLRYLSLESRIDLGAQLQLPDWLNASLPLWDAAFLVNGLTDPRALYAHCLCGSLSLPSRRSGGDAEAVSF